MRMCFFFLLPILSRKRETKRLARIHFFFSLSNFQNIPRSLIFFPETGRGFYSNFSETDPLVGNLKYSSSSFLWCWFDGRIEVINNSFPDFFYPHSWYDLKKYFAKSCFKIVIFPHTINKNRFINIETY